MVSSSELEFAFGCAFSPQHEFPLCRHHQASIHFEEFCGPVDAFSGSMYETKSFDRLLLKISGRLSWTYHLLASSFSGKF